MEKVLIDLTEEESNAGCNKDAAWELGEKNGYSTNVRIYFDVY